MLKHINIKNFKAWENLDITFGRVTGLFGANSSGKSSLLQFLLMLKQTKNATDRGISLDLGGSDQFVNLGTYRDMVHKHDLEKNIQYNLTWNFPKELKIHNPSGPRTEIILSGKELNIESSISYKKLEMRTESLVYCFDDRSFELSPKSPDSKEYQLTTCSDNSEDFEFRRTQGRVWKLPGPNKTHSFPDQVKTYHQNADFLSFFEIAYEGQMDKIFYLGPLREYPKREYQWGGQTPVDVGIRGQHTIEAIMSATSKGERRNASHKAKLRPFEEMIAYWLKDIGLIEEFRIEEIGTDSNLYRALVKRDRHSAEVLLTDVGFGVSQVLPALVLLYYVPEGSTILMEQPEIHLHPSVQSGLADVILAASENRDLQVIVESHSEYMLRRFQRRVAEETTQSNHIRLYFCNSKGGKSTLNDLGLNLFGEIENWPDNFFGDEMGEIAAIQRAALQRKIEATES